MATLYERLGGSAGIERILDDVLKLHLQNPAIAPRFQGRDLDRLKRMAVEFMSMGTGGPAQYTGKDMRAAHAGMNISEQEFLAAMDDIMAAMDKNGCGQAEKAEVLAALYSLKGDVIRV